MNDLVINNEWAGDVLNRKKYSLFLTKYLETKDTACVININAPWGQGKTFFLEHWHDDIKKVHPSVYFNAWKSDYSNDPLLSIISCINKEIIPLLSKNPTEDHAAKKFLTNSGKMLKKLAPILIKGAVNKALGEGGYDALADITSETEGTISDLSSKFAEELLASHEAISSSIDDFKNSVTLLIKKISKNQNLTSPLFIFIDELDRCRPLYSIELLERIKHVFGIPEVVFIVATDTQQLSHSVKAIYGEGFNGEIYLRRFFDQIYTLPEPNCIEFTTLLFEGFTQNTKFFEYGISTEGISTDPSFMNKQKDEKKYILTCKPQRYAEAVLIFSLFAKFFKLDLRSMKQCFDRFVVIDQFASQEEELHLGYLIFLIMLDAKHPDIFQNYFNCFTYIQKSEVINKLGNDFHNLIIANSHFTAIKLFERHMQTLAYVEEHPDQEVDLNNLGPNLTEEDRFNYKLRKSSIDNVQYLVKYRERVIMTQALG